MTAIFCTRYLHAGVAKLADALASGASGRKALGVQVPSSALVLYEQVPRRHDSREIVYGEGTFYRGGANRLQDYQDP